MRFFLHFFFNFQIFHHIHFGILFLIVGFSSSLSYLFLYCYFGKLATESFQKMTDCMFESNWQELPINLQKYLILMIANMQRPLHYHGSRIAVLNLVSFTKVSREGRNRKIIPIKIYPEFFEICKRKSKF